MTNSPSGTGRNQGEGDRESARRYNEDTQKFAKEGRVEEAAEKAQKAREGEERKELDEAEKAGRERAKEHDPAVKRDYSKGES